MGRKKDIYMVLDTETATLPFANEIAGGNAEVKKKIAIAKPLIYDFGYTLCYKDGTIIDRKQFLITETFSVPSVFNTAYYASKRPLYTAMIERNEIECLPWRFVMAQFEKDLEGVRAIGCFNSFFDLCKAIPFTELYISKLYSQDYFEWEKTQRKLCERIAKDRYTKKSETSTDTQHFNFRDETYECFDVWGMACERLLNTNAYKNKCLEYGMLTNSGDYFKSSAETAYRHLAEKYQFEEAHTALADAEIETYILAKCLKRGAVSCGISFFPFRSLGHPADYVEGIRNKKKQAAYAETVYNAICSYLGDDWEDEELTGYRKGMKNKAERLAKLF